jgi:hypothetical protein
MNLSRTRNGTMVHRRDCPQIIRYNFLQSRAAHWRWADTKNADQVAEIITRLGYTTCKHCRPINWHEVSW